VPWGTDWLMMLCSCREELHAARRGGHNRDGLSHVAVKATEASAPEAAETSTTAARPIADRPTHAYEATREAARPTGSSARTLRARR
jgi:hypothetical protein